MQDPAALKAAYRFLENDDEGLSFEALSRPHWEHTRQQARELTSAPGSAVVLMVMDITELDYTHYKHTLQGLGPIGTTIHQQGVLLHSTLAVRPAPRCVLGLMHQQIFKRELIPPGTRPEQRPKAQRESRVWSEALHAIGPAPQGRGKRARRGRGWGTLGGGDRSRSR
jgi:hypothetical protein